MEIQTYHYTHEHSHYTEVNLMMLLTQVNGFFFSHYLSENKTQHIFF